MHSMRLLILSFMLNNCLAYSSMENLKITLQIDEDVAEVLTNHLKSIENYQTLVQQYLTEYNTRTEFGTGNGNPIENPLFSFQMIRRVVVNQKQILNRFNKISSDLLKNLEKAMDGNVVTYKSDLVGAAEGVLRLQDSYLLHPHDLLRGKLKHKQTPTKLTISDCLFLAKVAEESLCYDVCSEWTEEAHSLCLNRTSFDACSQLTSPLYESAKLKHDETRAQLLLYPEINNAEIDYNQPTPTVWPNATSFIEPSKQRSQMIKSEQFTREYPQTRLCHKGSLLSETESSVLFCYYLRRDDDVYLLLHRYKVEMLSLTPRIITIFEVLSDEETELFKRLAIPLLERSQVHYSGGQHSVSNMRVSETGWLEDEMHPQLTIISKRIESITGLSVIDASESYQVANYGLGGWFLQHHDFYRKELSDVELGGATVFPEAKVHVPAIKRSATFWYNLDANGYPDMSTLHGGCPVLYGSKWIVTKWIYNIGGNFLKLKCPVEQPNQ